MLNAPPNSGPSSAAGGAAPRDKRLLYPLAEVRCQLGDLSLPSLYREIRSGRLQVVRVRRRTFVTGAELQRYVAELTAEQ